MKHISILPIAFILITFVAACAPSHNFHQSKLPDPASFNAHFGDMDANSDELVNWDEFKAFFKDADPKVYEALDLNKDSAVDHDEWHAFKEAHGLKHKE